MEMVDAVTGDIYCSWIENGEMKRVRGECDTIEFINDNEEVAEGEKGNVIITGLGNYSFPFIRYEVGDLGIKSNEKLTPE